MTELIRKTSELSELKVVDEEQGIVQAYVNTMGICNYFSRQGHLL